MSSLTTIRTASGVPFTVSADHATRFKSFLDELESSGYAIDKGQSGGFN